MKFSNALLIASIFVSIGCVAQNITDVEAKPYGSYGGGTLDTVDLATGNLLLHIPLVSFPQKGSLPPLTFSVELNNAPYVQTQWDACGPLYGIPDPAGAGYWVGGPPGDPGNVPTNYELQCQLLSSRYDTSPPGAVYQQQPSGGKTVEPLFSAPSPHSTDANCDTYNNGSPDSTPCGTYDVWGKQYSVNTLQNVGVHLASSFEGGVVLGSYYQSTGIVSNGNPVYTGYKYQAIDPSGTAHQLESDSTISNVYRTSDGSGYTFSPSQTSSIDILNASDDGGGLRLGTLISPTGMRYSDSIHSYTPPPGNVYSVQHNEGAQYTPTAIFSTETDPTGNAITRGPWYWSGYESVNSQPYADIDAIYAASGQPPVYQDSVGRTIPDVVAMQSTQYQWTAANQASIASMPWTIKGPGGNNLTYTINYALVANVDSFDPSVTDSTPDPATSIHASGYGISSIQLPNGSSWTFNYCGPATPSQCLASDGSVDAFPGDLTSLSTPMGEFIAYTYTAISLDSVVKLTRCNSVCHAVSSRSVSDGNGNTWKTTYSYGFYTTPSGLPADCKYVTQGNVHAYWTIETDPNHNDTVHMFCIIKTTNNNIVSNQYHEVLTQYYQGYSPLNPAAGGSPNQPLKTVQTQYQSDIDIQLPGDTEISGITNVLPTQITTTTPGGSTTEARQYATMFTTEKQFLGGNPVQQTTSSGSVAMTIPVSYLSPTHTSINSGTSGSGTPLRTSISQFAFQNPPSSAYLLPIVNMVALPISSQTLDSALHQVTQTSYYYDDATRGDTCGFNASVVPCGESTSITRWLNTATNGLTTTTAYASGMPVLETDANGNQTKIVYDPSNCESAYPSQIIKAYGSSTALPETTSLIYDCSGALFSTTDTNGTVTRYLYPSSDLLGRLTEVDYGYSSSANTQYSKTVLHYPSMTEVDVTQDQSAQTGSIAAVELTTKTFYDGLGRVVQQTNPAGYSVWKAYSDDSSNVASVTNPGVSLPLPTTSYFYDALGRMVKRTIQDGSSTYWCFDSTQTMLSSVAVQPTSLCSPTGTGTSWVSSQDESGNLHLQSYDALGQLAVVAEPNPQTGSLTSGALGTTYGYDGLGNLTSVVQSGTSGDVARNRSFTYDSLSRLLCASNPENSTAACPSTATNTYTSGTVGYSYDLNGNVQTKTDARGITVSYAYDGLNRLLSKSYGSASKTPASCYEYDRTPSSLSGTPIANPIGHITAEWTQIGGCPTGGDLPTTGLITSKVYLNYDIMGRVKNEQQCAMSGCGAPFNLSYAYDLAGHVTSSDNGLGTLSWQPTYDSAGRLASVAGTSAWVTPQFPSQVLSGTQYGPAGITGWNLGAMTDGTTPAITLTKSYDQQTLRVLTEGATGHQ